jgi:hypothetical protein
LPRNGGHLPDQSGGQPRDWPVPPRVAELQATATAPPRAVSTTPSPRRPASPPGGLDVLV